MFDTIREWQVWLIYLLPLGAFALITAHYLLPRAARPSPRTMGWLAIAAVFVSFLLALWTLKAVSAEGGERIGFAPHRWLEAGPLTIDVGMRVDGLTSVMLVVVTSVAFLVQFYSQGYMAGDPGYPRFFAFLSLFTAAMLGLVLASNLIMLFVHWELVGLCSYLLVGFWFSNPPRPGYTSPAAAAKKAFIVTRVGDLGFLLAILLIWTRTDTFDIARIQELAVGDQIRDWVLVLFALGIFAGAAGKSAQFPLHTWLPDAMEGPTPVSALIHAATMVAAGVYLVARLFPIYHASESATAVVAAVGAITAVMAATMGMVMQDIKRVLAYSTISQLGYMMLALGAGGLVAGIFHLMNHAFFKALLFLGSGSVNHATHTFDMQKMGGLRSAMPATFLTFLVGALSLAAIPPLSGFWSKDEILVAAWHYNKAVWAAGLGVAALTAFYMGRVICLTFLGEFRGGDPAGAHGHGAAAHDAPAPADHAAGHTAPVAAMPDVVPHESPPVMWLPLAVLAVPAVISGFVNAGILIGHPFGEFVQASLPEALREGAEPEFIPWMAVASSALALGGLAVALTAYGFGGRLQVPLPGLLRSLHTLFARKYYMDDLYERVFVSALFYGGLCRLVAWFDEVVVDGVVNGVGRATTWAGGVLRRAQTGSEQSYGLVLTGGAAIVALIIFVSALR
jgi:NADH-quinone oxidoreductase subunit L